MSGAIRQPITAHTSKAFPAVTFPELLEAISPRVVADPLAWLIGCTQEFYERVPGTAFANRDYSAFALGALSLAILHGMPQLGPEHPVPGDLFRKPVTADNLLRRAAQLVMSKPARTCDIAHDPLDRLNFKIQFLAQAALAGRHLFQFVRTLYLLELEDFDPPSSREASPYDQLFHESHGCSARDYMGLLFGLTAYGLSHAGQVGARQSILVEPEKCLASCPRRAELLGPLRDLLRRHSCDANAVGHLLDTRYAMHDGNGLVQRFYWEHPFISFPSGSFLLPAHPFLRLHAATGAFFQTLDLALRLQQQSDTKKSRATPESVRLGRRFQDFVGHLVYALRPLAEVVPEYVYQRSGGERRSPDFLIFGRDSSNLVLVEAKLKRLGPGTFFGYDRESILSDMERGFGALIRQPIKYLAALEQASQRGKLSPETAALSERVLKAERIFILGVVPAMPSIFQDDDARNMLLDIVERGLTEPECLWFRANRKRIAGWHVLDSEELAVYAGAFSHRSLFESLVQYVQQPGFGVLWDDAGRVLASFCDFMIGDLPDRVLWPLPSIHEAYRRFGTYATKLFFPDGPGPWG